MKCFELLGRNLMVATSGDQNDAVELEPIVPKAEFDADAESGSLADIWSSTGRYPPQTRHDHNSRRRLRSRSSPVRTVEDKKERRVRARSPSAWSPRRRARERSRERNSRHPGPYAPPEYGLDSATPSEEYLQTSNSIWCGTGSTSGTAYFSPCPPAAPLRLIPIVSPAQPPIAPSMSSGVMRIARVSYAKKRPDDCHNTVHGLLRELVASLPLQTFNPEPSICPFPSVHTPHLENDEPTLSSRSYVKIRHSSMSTSSRGDQVQRSIAIQAKSTQDDDAVNEQTETGSDAAPAEEWLGGVRALRDSHVRLVLRQLRHIDRLNRTLDRAARPPPPPPPSSPRAPPAITPTAQLTVAVTAQAQV